MWSPLFFVARAASSRAASLSKNNNSPVADCHRAVALRYAPDRDPPYFLLLAGVAVVLALVAVVAGRAVVVAG